MNFKVEEPVSITLIKEFVYQAKLHAFASSGKKTTLNNQSSIFSYRGFGDEHFIGNPAFSGMIYTDEYSGNTVEAGMETVSINLCNVWRNQYYGGSYHSWWEKANGLHIQTNKPISYLPFITIEFLKCALRKLPRDFPIRGPKFLQADVVEYEGTKYYADWIYQNQWEQIPLYNTNDPFAAFQGKETIRCNGEIIYWHGYQGGFLRDKYYPIKLQQ